LYASSGSATPGDAVWNWVNGENEMSAYNPDNPTYSHFTQVVWKSTTQLGCAIVNCHPAGLMNTDGSPLFEERFGDSLFAVCEYDPPGNIDTKAEYDKNVQLATT